MYRDRYMAPYLFCILLVDYKVIHAKLYLAWVRTPAQVAESNFKATHYIFRTITSTSSSSYFTHKALKCIWITASTIRTYKPYMGSYVAIQFTLWMAKMMSWCGWACQHLYDCQNQYISQRKKKRSLPLYSCTSLSRSSCMLRFTASMWLPIEPVQSTRKHTST